MTLPAPRWTSEACCETIRRNVALIESEGERRRPAAGMIDLAADHAIDVCHVARSEALLTETQIEQALA